MQRLGAPIIGLMLATMPASAAPDCGCDQFEALQQELDNAVKLRDRHKAKAEDMERRERAGESPSRLRADYSDWEKDPRSGAGAGLVATTQSRQSAISYVPRGARLIENGTISGWSRTVQRDGYEVSEVDPAKAHAIEKSHAQTGEDLCDFADVAAVEKSAQETSPCKGVGDLLVGHENSHRDTCRRMGFIAFYFRSASELARDEVKAYDAQIQGLKALLGKALDGAEAQFEDDTHIQWSASMFSATYDFKTRQAKGAIPKHDGDSWSVKLKGVHSAAGSNIRAYGSHCTVSGYTRDVFLSVAARGKDVTVTFDRFGATPPTRSSCPGLPARGGSFGTGPEEVGKSFTVPLARESRREEDVGKGEVAKLAAANGVKLTGSYRAKLSIICPPAK